MNLGFGDVIQRTAGRYGKLRARIIEELKENDAILIALFEETEAAIIRLTEFKGDLAAFKTAFGTFVIDMGDLGDNVGLYHSDIHQHFKEFTESVKSVESALLQGAIASGQEAASTVGNTVRPAFDTHMKPVVKVLSMRLQSAQNDVKAA